jgi:hypothetical protein
MDGIHLLANAQGVCSRPNPGPPLWGQACIPALSVGVRPAFVLLGSPISQPKSSSKYNPCVAIYRDATPLLDSRDFNRT